MALEGQEVFESKRKDSNNPEEQKPEPPETISSESDPGEKTNAESDIKPKNVEKKVSVWVRLFWSLSRYTSGTPLFKYIDTLSGKE